MAFHPVALGAQQIHTTFGQRELFLSFFFFRMTKFAVASSVDTTFSRGKAGAPLADRAWAAPTAARAPRRRRLSRSHRCRSRRNSASCERCSSLRVRYPRECRVCVGWTRCVRRFVSGWPPLVSPFQKKLCVKHPIVCREIRTKCIPKRSTLCMVSLCPTCEKSASKKSPMKATTEKQKK